ncbi:MAG: glycine cleavage system protein GcvH [Anaerolineae bacterium]
MANWQTPADLKYQKSDEWVRIEGDTATIGITDYAQDALNDLVYLEFAASVGAELKKGEVFGSVESVKAQSELVMPIGGTVTELNTALEKSPEAINSDPFGSAWMVKIKVKNAAEADSLMDAAAYAAFCENR